MVNEAQLERVASGWLRSPPDGSWSTRQRLPGSHHDSFGGVCIFESDDFVLRGRPDLTEYIKPHAGFTIRVVPPDGSPAVTTPSRCRRTS